MNIGEYNKKKKDPQAWLEQRSFEILRELEAILAQIKPQIAEKNSEIDTYSKENTQKLQKLATQTETTIEKVKDLQIAIHELSTFTDKTSDDFAKKTKEVINSIETRLSDALQRIEIKVAEVQKHTPKKGEKGDPGEPGKKGDDGSPDTANQIAGKLNTTQETVDMSVIKGLQKELASIKREVSRKEKGGGGGGGMGQVQHESTNISSATTQVTTAYKIAGNGYAIMGAYYQGQLIMRGTHYTVGGDRKTLSLLFTPQDSTVIDIIYVRG